MIKQKLLTTGKIATRLGVSRDRVQYAIRSLALNHKGKSGRYHLFDTADIAAIRKYLKTVDQRRQAAAIQTPTSIPPEITPDVSIVIRERDRAESTALKSLKTAVRAAVAEVIQKTLTAFRRTAREAITNSKTGGDKAGNDSKNKN